MNALLTLQASFAAALLGDDDEPVLHRLRGPHAASRLAVYRNNVLHGLIEALGAAYPVLRQVLGAELFDALAGEYAREQPPRHAALLDYGASFGAFCERHAAVAALGYVNELAALERARLRAWHAADYRPLDAAMLATLPAAELPALQLALAPEATLLACRYPVAAIHAAHAETPPRAFAQTPQAQWLLVYRPQLQVQIRELSPGAHALLAALASGNPLAAAAASARHIAPTFELIAEFAALLAAGVFSAYQTPPTGESLP